MGKNKEKVQLKGREVLGKKIVILGEVGSGKTKLAAELLREFMTLMNPQEITVIDLAPKRIGGIGGKLTEYVNMNSGVIYLSPKNVYTPRLASTSPKQLLLYAELNRKIMEPLLNRFIQNVTEVLVLNDVTLYLHSGKLETVLKCARLTKTFLVTAYYGSKLSKDLETGISSREKRLTEKLATTMDLTIRID